LAESARLKLFGNYGLWTHIMMRRPLRFFQMQGEQQGGFTIIELMVATLIFAVILVVITTGVISFSKGYYKGLNSSATQAAARDLINGIGQGIQYAGDSNTVTWNQISGSPYGVVCAGNVHYYYTLGTEYDGSSANYGVYQTTIGDPGHFCTPGVKFNPTSDPTGKQLLAPNMRLTDISITPPSSTTSGLGYVTVGVAYGDDDLICSTALAPSGQGGCNPSATALLLSDFVANGNTVTCKATAGSQFCAAVHLNTAVQPRL
jgi:prepilin-type N-terminal cleavage/methylation domain-containing protein